MLLRAAALPAAALSTTFLLTSVIDQQRSLTKASDLGLFVRGEMSSKRTHVVVK